MWDASFGTPTDPASSAYRTLQKFSGNLIELPGTSPLALDAVNTQAVWNYLNREGRVWSTDARDTLNGLRIGSHAYNPSDFSHVDAYILDASHGDGGQWPAAFQTPDEDLTSGHSLGDVQHFNSTMLPGPPHASPFDEAGTGWTAPGSLQFVDFNHEMAHGFLQGGLLGSGPMAGGFQGELWSAAAEVVSGINYQETHVEVPYTWSLLAWCDPTGGCVPQPAPGNNRFSQSNYQARTSFMAYVGYNFLGANTNRTLAGMQDDLMYKWVRASNRTLLGLQSQLGDATCATCAAKSYFHPLGVAMPNTDRLQVLHHNWRVANFVNNPGLAEGQFGLPAWSGFSPANNQGAWQSIDGVANDDIVALPQVVDLGPHAVLKDTTFKWQRSMRGANHPLALTVFSANYWVFRPTAGLQSLNRDLVIRVSPQAYYDPGYLVNSNGNHYATSDVRLMASAVAYDSLDLASGDASSLWQHPNAASFATSVSWTDTDTLTGEVTVTIPSFGVTHKAVVLVVTLADGRKNSWTSDVDLGYEELLPYRLDAGLRSTASDSQIPVNISSVLGSSDDWPAWSPASDELVYSTIDPAVSPWMQIYRRRLDGTPPARIAPQSATQSFPDWSPRGGDIVWSQYAANGQVDLWETLSGQAAQKLTSIVGASYAPAYAPNGEGIAYLCDHATADGFAWDLRFINRDGTGDRLVSRFLYPNYSVAPLLLEAPRWSRDGKYLYVADYNHQILRCPASGGAPTVVPIGVTEFANFDLHPGKGRIALTSTSPLPNWGPTAPPSYIWQPSIQVQRAALLDTTAGVRDTSYRFITRGAFAQNVRWSRDGLKLAYSASQGDAPSDRNLFAARADWNHAPSLMPMTDMSVPACTPFTFGPITASDPDGEAVTLEVSMMPSGMTFDSQHVLRWQFPEPGEYNFVVRAMDGTSGVDSKVIHLSCFYSDNCDAALTGGAGGGGGSFGNGRAGAFYVAPTAGSASGNSMLDGTPESGGWVDRSERLAGLAAGTDGVVHAKLHMGSGSSALVDRVRLRVVDRPAGTIACATATGVAVGRATSLGSLAANDGASVSLSNEFSVQSQVFAAGTSLTGLVPDSARADAIVTECRRAGPLAQSVQEGVTVQMGDGVTWTPIGTIHPRRDWDELAVLASGGHHVRLVFGADAEVRSMRSLTRVDHDSLVATTLVAPSDAGDASVLQSIVAADDSALTLTNGDDLPLVFNAPTQASGTERSWFLDLRGRYEAGAGAAAQARQTEVTPARFEFAAPTPNPFSHVTTLAFALPSAGRVQMEIMDAQGRRVRTLIEEDRPAGRYDLTWDGHDSAGRAVAPGVYLARIVAGSDRGVRRVVLAR